MGIRKANNQGLVAMTAVANGDLMHTLVAGRTVVIRKIMCYNVTGANITLQFGTQTNAGVLLLWFPLFVAIDPFDNEWLETEIPYREFTANTTAGAAGWTGDIWCLGSAANPTVLLEVEEFGT